MLDARPGKAWRSHKQTQKRTVGVPTRRRAVLERGLTRRRAKSVRPPKTFGCRGGSVIPESRGRCRAGARGLALCSPLFRRLLDGSHLSPRKRGFLYLRLFSRRSSAKPSKRRSASRRRRRPSTLRASHRGPASVPLYACVCR